MELIETIKKSKEFANFQQIVKNNKLSHSYLVYSENAEINKIFCKICASFLIGKIDIVEFHPDILYYPKDKNLLVEDSKEIIENSATKPMVADSKIFIISDIDTATVQAQNKLLKTIEEANKSVVYFFTTTNKNKVLQTIISRTQLFSLENLSKEDLSQNKNYEFIVNMLSNMKSSKDVLSFTTKFANKSDFVEKLKTLQFVFEEVLYQNNAKTNKNFSFANDYSNKAIKLIFDAIIEAKKQFDANVNTNLISDNLLLKIMEAKYYGKKDWSKSSGNARKFVL